MTPSEIRVHSAKMFEIIKSGLAKDNNVDSCMLSVQLQIMQASWEIAAQLMELNQTLSQSRISPPAPSLAGHDSTS
jgi:hypothetical protein